MSQFMRRAARALRVGLLASAAMDFVAAIASSHVDFVGIGDSNQLFGGYGWDWGWQYALSQYYPMYATGLISANENSGSGGSIGRYYAYSNGSDVGALSGAPTDLNQYWNIGTGSTINRYGYLDDAGSYSSFTGLQLDSNCDVDVNAALRFRYHYGTFPAGSGSTTFAVRRADSPFTVLGEQTVNPVTGSYGMTYADITLTGAARNYPLTALWQKAGTTMQGPFFGTFVHATNTGRTAGYAYNTLHGVGGQSLYDMLFVLQQIGVTGLGHYFGIIRSRQLQSQKMIVVMINSGLNDRNETETSLGPSPQADGDSPEAYADNLAGIVNLIENTWAANSWDSSELRFVFVPSHPISTPDDAKLVSYRTAVRQYLATKSHASIIDLSQLTNPTEMLANSWYASSGADTSHLTQAGYEQLALRMLNSIR